MNRWITKNYPEHNGTIMETFDLSECYSKLDQKEILKVLSQMIAMAFLGKKVLAVVPSENTGRWIDSHDEALPRETLFTEHELRTDVHFLTKNAYIEWLGKAWKQVKGIPMGLGISPFLCDYYLLFWELKWCELKCLDIRNLTPGAQAIIPTLISTTRYLDDIWYIFAISNNGASSL